MAFCLANRFRGRRNLRWLLPRSNPPNPVGAHEQREAAMAFCLVHRFAAVVTSGGSCERARQR